ncbi:hypothetical protein MtrunA17_Chr1g0165801 [Medicago truncatula]|uniref:Uncharacterized protein n=1 Tax=Medicago truncatula TaxID=3880 RepID=A0A396JUV1_MEDTR|nr:hypothetical protein MtrunA17_Chr1g0165801 [Medicago truncatula]
MIPETNQTNTSRPFLNLNKTTTLSRSNFSILVSMTMATLVANRSNLH